jgi:hypothetical protein
MTEKNLIKTFIYKEELELLEIYTSCKMSTVKKINTMIEDKLTKKPNIKRFNILLPAKELDSLIASIAGICNEERLSGLPEIIHLKLNGMFGRFADKYNNHLHNKSL